MLLNKYSRNDLEMVKNMSKKLSDKLKQTTTIITDICNFVTTNSDVVESMLNPCPNKVDSLNVELDIVKFLARNITRHIIKGGLMDSYMQNLFKEILKKKPISINIKQQYFVSHNDPQFIGCTEKFNEFNFR